jgi:hypothetical protein
VPALAKMPLPRMKPGDAVIPAAGGGLSTPN